jgi:hypothetical protein
VGPPKNQVDWGTGRGMGRMVWGAAKLLHETTTLQERPEPMTAMEIKAYCEFRNPELECNFTNMISLRGTPNVLKM